MNVPGIGRGGRRAITVLRERPGIAGLTATLVRTLFGFGADTNMCCKIIAAASGLFRLFRREALNIVLNGFFIVSP
jgi:hypothetical protein